MNRNSDKVAESTAAYSDHEYMPYLLTVKEVAELLRTSKKAVYSMAERGKLPGVTRIGIRLLIARDDLLKWLNERRTLSSGSDGR